jgi:hypothetical protein
MDQIERKKKSRTQKIPSEECMFVLCVVSKGKMHDNQYKERCTDEVQTENKTKQKSRWWRDFPLPYRPALWLTQLPVK